MKSQIIYTFIVMLLCCTIYSKAKAQSYGLESNGDGSYTIYMFGGSVTTNNMGQYSSPNYQYNMTTGEGYWTTGQGSMCNGCFGVPVISTANNIYYSPTYTYQALAGTPPSSYSSTGVSGNYQMYYNSSGGVIAQVPFAIGGSSGSGYSYISGYSEGCPSCAAAAATQAAATQWNNNNISIFQAQSATLQQNILNSLQTQMTAALNQLNWYNYNYYYYSVAYLTNGNSGAVVNPPTPFPPSPADTLRPTKIICNDTSNAFGNEITHILADTADKSAAMKEIRDSVGSRGFEVALTLNRRVPNGTPLYLAEDYVSNGTNPQAASPLHSGLSVADFHTHPIKGVGGINDNVPSPSPKDIVGLYSAWNDYSSRRFMTRYTLYGGPVKDEYAIHITDTAVMKAFFLANPLDSVVDSRQFITGPGGTNIPNPRYNDWAGADLDETSFLHQFNIAFKDFKLEGYPPGDAVTYANVYMLKGMGIKMYKKVDGQFKELNYAPQIGADGKVHKKITICL